MSEREHDEGPAVDEESPEDLDPRAEAERVRGGAAPLASNVQKTQDDIAKATVNNMK